MIDYYKAIDTETGQEVSYLREVSNRISPEMSAQDCFVALSFLPVTLLVSVVVPFSTSNAFL